MRTRSRWALVGATLLVFSASPLVTRCQPTRDPVDRRGPCERDEWDPNRPLVVDFVDADDPLPVDSPWFRDGVQLWNEDGESVPLQITALGYEFDYVVLLCVPGGLEPDADYEWDVSDFGVGGRHSPAIPAFLESGSWTFSTKDETEWPAPSGTCKVAGRSTEDYLDGACPIWMDSGWTY